MRQWRLGVFSLAVVLALTVPVSAQSSSPPETTVRLELIGDPHWGNEVNVSVSRDAFMGFFQNRVGSDGKTAFSYVAMGAKFRFGDSLNASILAGPQYTYRAGGKNVHGFDRFPVLLNAAYRRGDWELSNANRLSFGMRRDTLFTNRHVLAVHSPGMPKSVKLRVEALHTPAGWVELFLGGQATWKRGRFEGSVFGYRDIARGAWSGRGTIGIQFR